MEITISTIKGRQILDSRGNPTVEADVILSDGSLGRVAVPSGASTGKYEALELRDGDPAKYGGKSVEKAVSHINVELQELLGNSPFDQAAVDEKMRQIDGTPDKSRLGANAILAVSLAVAKSAANSRQQSLYEYVAEVAGVDLADCSLPMPMMNVMNGGQHALGSTDIQEYMIVPVGAPNFAGAIRMGAEVFHTLAKILREENYPTTVGDEGGYAPSVRRGNLEPIQLILRAIETAGYQPGKDIALALDVAASEFYEESGDYFLATEERHLSSERMIDWYEQIVERYPLVSIEDGLDEEDWGHWQTLTAKLGDRVQLVGDDLLVTNTERLKRAIDERAANSILIKPNQIGTLTETIEAVKLAKQAGWRTVMSHRSGETEDTTISHLAVGLATGQIKTGSLSRTDRVAKYNEILRIAESNPGLKLARPFEV